MLLTTVQWFGTILEMDLSSKPPIFEYIQEEISYKKSNINKNGTKFSKSNILLLIIGNLYTHKL